MGSRMTPRKYTRKSWESMHRRCEDPRNISFSKYGAKGISVCPQWSTLDGFIADMGLRPPGTTIDRIDAKGNYEPGNCRWASYREQNANLSKNVFIERDGLRLHASEWSRRTGINVHTLIRRARARRSTEDIFTEGRLRKRTNAAIAEVRRCN